MAELLDGQSVEMQGSGSKPYILKNIGGVYSCSCPAWKNQSTPIERRTCKHLRKLLSDDFENKRLAGAGATSLPPRKADVRTLKEVGSSVIAVAFSGDGARLLSAGTLNRSGVIRQWDFASGELLTQIAAPSERVTSVAFLNEARIISSSGRILAEAQRT